jgi:hypothetical protein
MTAKAKKFRAKYFATEFMWRCFYEQFGSKQVNNKFGRRMKWRWWTRTWSQLVWKQWGIPMITGHNLKAKSIHILLLCLKKTTPLRLSWFSRIPRSTSMATMMKYKEVSSTCMELFFPFLLCWDSQLSLPAYTRSFVVLRNRIAHSSKRTKVLALLCYLQPTRLHILQNDGNSSSCYRFCTCCLCNLCKTFA